MNSIFQSASSATPVDLTQKLFSLTAGIIFRIAFGRSFQGSSLHHDRFHEVVHECEAVLGSFSAQEYLPYVGWIVDRLTGHQARLDRVFHKMDSFFEHVIEDHIASGNAEKDQEDIVDLMIRMQRDQTEHRTTRLTKDNIKGVLLLEITQLSA
ncbi:putative cytochrome P450 [Tripterygium wilfordii]|uniref:Putative cytochrome P450 n=1 Tax=Tripterygium wilfordii TaxID=458696 RepID=A0A7J7BXV4_TRIWF|nr:putative cytochrome P450 [Tripterygium wilfordii]